MAALDYYIKNYHFLEYPMAGVTPGDGQPMVLVGRRGPFVAMVERATSGAVWNGRLLFGMPDKDGLAGSPTLLGVAEPHHHLNVVLMRLATRAHEVKRATLEACSKKKRKKHDYGTPKKRA